VRAFYVKGKPYSIYTRVVLIVMYRIFYCYWLFIPHLAAAPFNLNDDDQHIYASEALDKSDFDTNGHLLISSAGDVLYLDVESDFGLSSDARYIRFDVINGAFNTSFPISGLAASGSFDSILSAGGGVGDSFIIIEVSASPSVGADTIFSLESTSFQWFDSSQPLQIRYSLYDTAAAAVNQTTFLSQLTTDFATLSDASGSEYTRSFSHYVGFTQDFLRFNPTYRSPSVFSLGDASGTLASMGKVLFEQLILDDALLASTSLAITDFRDLIPDSDTSANNSNIYGDFSSVEVFLNADDDCTGASLALTSYSEASRVVVSIDDLVSYPVFCIRADSNEVPVKRATYELELGVGYNRSHLGEIKYDAASIDIPYLTNFEGYRQRIYLVNHAGYDVAYSSRFISEGSVGENYTAGNNANGTLLANSTLVLSSQDVVTIDDGVPTRVSVRIFLDSKPEDISAAVQIFSLGSQDAPTTEVLVVEKH
jgi:hypothetical protein